MNLAEFLESKKYKARCTISQAEVFEYEVNKRISPELLRALQHAISSEIAKYARENKLRFVKDDFGINAILDVFILSEQDLADIINTALEDADG